MPLVVFHSRNVTNALKARAPAGVDLLVLVGIAGLAGALILFGEQFTSAYHDKVVISLSYRALPKYTFFSAMRGSAAYVLSLAFTLVYGTIAAHSHRAERVMMPVLDILQAIPVLSFLPGAVLALIAIFPHSQVGLELSCILMIFTGQAWNMTFSFHGSLKGIPPSLREVAALNRYSWLQTFRFVEVPAAMIGLIWNSMMSMAGGWFFLTTVEAFTLKDRDFRLPGVGSYMAEANDQHAAGPLIAGSVAIIVMIVAFDQLLWRPLVAWAQKFKLEENSEAKTPQSWLLSVLGQSRLLKVIEAVVHRRPKVKLPSIRKLLFRREGAPGRAVATAQRIVEERQVMRYGVAALVVGAGCYGMFALYHLVSRVPWWDKTNHQDWPTIVLALLTTFTRTSVAVALGALWTLPVGILIGRSPRLSSIMQPIIQTAASYPAPMIFPLITLLLLWLHVPFTIGCVALLLLGAQWYVLFNVIAGAMAIPADLKEAAAAYGMSRRDCWTKLYIPCVFPYLVTGLITATGGAWNATIVAEYMTIGDRHFAAFGLGSIIAQASNDENFPVLAASTVTMAIFVVLLNRFFWKYLYRLAEQKYSLGT
jgi:NitT/TauT family transport system permease protein